MHTIGFLNLPSPIFEALFFSCTGDYGAVTSNWSSKRDWLLFRNKLAGWQEAYIGRLNKEYIELLRGDGSEADKFWELCKRIREDRRCAGVQISMRGSDPLPIICRMINEGVITLGDLDEFSEELREAVATITEPHKDI